MKESTREEIGYRGKIQFYFENLIFDMTFRNPVINAK